MSEHKSVTVNCNNDSIEKFHSARISKTQGSGAYSGEDLEFFRQTLKMKPFELAAMLNHARNCEATNP